MRTPKLKYSPRHNNKQHTAPHSRAKHSVYSVPRWPARPPPGEKNTCQDLAKADADALNVDVEGMFAKVEAHTSTLIRLWVCVEHSRLFEGLATRAVEALGLDPSKDVMVRACAALVCLLECIIFYFHTT